MLVNQVTYYDICYKHCTMNTNLHWVVGNWGLSSTGYCGSQSINQSNPVLLKERVRIPRTRRARGAAMLWRRLPLDGVGSCRLFFTDDLHDNLSWVPASDKPHTFKSCFTHSSQVFFGRPGPFLPGTGLDLTLFISAHLITIGEIKTRARLRLKSPTSRLFTQPFIQDAGQRKHQSSASLVNSPHKEPVTR